MNARIGRVLMALAALAVPLHADLTGITTTPANLPSAPSEMTVGGGYLWILTEAGNLGRMAPGGTYVEYPLQFGKDQNGIPNAANLAYGFDGNVWVSGFNGHVDRITPAGVVSDFTAVGINEQANIVSGADNAMWFFYIPRFGSTSDNSSKLARIDIYGQVTTYQLGLGTDFFGSLVSGGDGNLWFMDGAKNEIVKFSIGTGTVAGTFPLPSKQNGGGNGVLGLDGNVWFTNGAAIDRVKPDGTITEFPIPSGSQASDLTFAGDGNLWFAEYSAGKIGQLVVSSITSGGSATINESGAILPNGESLILLPPGFVTVSGKTGALDSKPCPLITFISKKTPPTAGIFVSTTVPQSQCADLVTNLSITTNMLDFQTPTGSVQVRVRNDGPNDAETVKTVVSFLCSGCSVRVTSVAPSSPDVQQTSNGSLAVLTKPTLSVGETFSAEIFLSFTNDSNNSEGSTSGAVAIALSATPDPNAYNNVATVGETISGGTKVPLQPNFENIIDAPVQRGK